MTAMKKNFYIHSQLPFEKLESIKLKQKNTDYSDQPDLVIYLSTEIED